MFLPFLLLGRSLTFAFLFFLGAAFFIAGRFEGPGSCSGETASSFGETASSFGTGRCPVPNIAFETLKSPRLSRLVWPVYNCLTSAQGFRRAPKGDEPRCLQEPIEQLPGRFQRLTPEAAVYRQPCSVDCPKRAGVAAARARGSLPRLPFCRMQPQRRVSRRANDTIYFCPQQRRERGGAASQNA